MQADTITEKCSHGRGDNAGCYGLSRSAGEASERARESQIGREDTERERERERERVR